MPETSLFHLTMPWNISVSKREVNIEVDPFLFSFTHWCNVFQQPSILTSLFVRVTSCCHSETVQSRVLAAAF